MSTTRPSTHWSVFGGLTPDSGTLFEQINDVLKTANFKHLEKVALDVRQNLEADLDPNVKCHTDVSKFAHGFNNVVLEVAFSDDIYWIAKIQHSPMDETDAVYISMRPCQPMEFEHPFTLMEYLPGQPLGGGISQKVPDEYLPKVAKQLAQVLFALEHQMAFQDLGILWCGSDGSSPPRIIPSLCVDSSGDLDAIDSGNFPRTSLEWFYDLIQSQNREAIEQHPDDREWNAACWVMKNALSHIIVDDRVHGPFPLCHMDLHHGNLLFDEEYNLTGVLDWSHAQTVPLERLAVSPEFVSGPGVPSEQKDACRRLVDLIRQSLVDLEQESTLKHQASLSDQSGSPVSSKKRKRSTDAQEDAAEAVATTTLATIFGTKRAEIANRCTYVSPRVILWFGRMVHGIIYGDHSSWEHTVDAFDGMSPI